MRRAVGQWIVVAALAAAGCATGPAARDRPSESETGVEPAAEVGAVEAAVAARPGRPIPYPVVPSPMFRRAIHDGTRTRTGHPGADYWQQRVDYDIEVRVDVDAKVLEGSETIRYHNRSPYELQVLVANLIQNFHAPGVPRGDPTELTGGIEIERVAVGGRELTETSGEWGPGWSVDGTLLYLNLPSAVGAGGVVELEIDWSFPIPAKGARSRMGHTGDQLLYLAYWFPQMAVFDDVLGWHTDPFRGNAEFYSDFGNYRLTIDAPEGWLVMGTGTLQNPDDVLAPDVAERRREAGLSDDVVRVVSHDRDRSATADSRSGRLRWEFAADSVRDVAFAVMRDYAWDAARSEVGDRDGDGEPEFTRVDAFWRREAVLHDDVWRYAQHAVRLLSEFTGLPYPWPHFTVVEGEGITPSGMEYPMMTLVADYEAAGDTTLYGTIAHEVAHSWLPMTLNTNERRHAWLDEGTTEFHESVALGSYFEGYDPPFGADADAYRLSVARGTDAPIMRWSDLHRSDREYVTATYRKPAVALRMLMEVLGEAEFMEAYRAFFSRWAFRHAYPWDLFNTFEDVAGRDLDWFWRPWYYESTQDGAWHLDQGIASVERLPGGETRIRIEDHGWIPMPVRLRIVRSDGEVIERTVPVERWLSGATEAMVTVAAGARVVEVVIDPDDVLPDMDSRDDVWPREER